jgi:hypothetical protein
MNPNRTLLIAGVTLVASLIGAVVIVTHLFKDTKIAIPVKVEIEQPKPQPKDTTTYNWSDELTNEELRELCRTGKLIIK